VLCLASLGCCGLQEPSEQSRHRGYVLACPGEARESVVILDDSPMRVTGTHAHLNVVLHDLVLEGHVLLLRMESRSLKLLLPLPQLVHTLAGWDLCVRHSPAPISRVRGSPVPP
jgi:hypothetical protein